MRTRVRLIRRFPPNENAKPLKDRRRWFWTLRWRDVGGALMCDTVGYFAGPRDDWRPVRGATERLTVKEAERARQQRQAEIEAGTVKPRPSPSAQMPWDDFKATYLAETKGTVRDSTLKCYREAMEVFAKHVQPATPAHVTTAMVKRFVQAMRADDRSDATIKKHISSLRRIWNDPLTETGNGNPFVIGRNGLRIRLTVQEKEWHWYSRDEIQSVLAACPDLHWRTLIFTAYTTGLRLGELLNLRWHDVDMETLDVHVRPRPDSDDVWAWVPKGKLRRTVPLTSHAVGMIQRLQVAAGACPYVFIRPDRYMDIQRQRRDGKWHSGREVQNNSLRDYHKILRRAGVTVDAFHSLRKSCIANWLEGGIVPHEVQAMAGHASIETTMKYYSKVRVDAKARVREASERYTLGVIA